MKPSARSASFPLTLDEPRAYFRLVRAHGWVALVGLSLAMVTTSALAAPTQAEQDARKSFDLGNKLYTEHAFREALAAFQHAYELDPRPSSLQNVGQCYRDLQDFAAAYDAYAELVERFGADMKGPKLETAQKALSELADVTSVLRFGQGVEGVEIKVDGRPVTKKALAKGLRVSVGMHRITATRDGFLPWANEVETKPGSSVDVAPSLSPEPHGGHVNVGSSGPAGAHLFIDGRDAGVLPWQGELPKGSHRIDARGTGVVSDPIDFRLDDGQSLGLTLVVRPTTAELVVEARDPSALITVDGQTRGRGRWTGTVSAGKHVVETRGASIERRELVASAGETTSLSMGAPASGGGAKNGALMPLGVTALAVGGVTLGVGIATGVLTLNKHSELAKECPGGVCYGAAKSKLAGYQTVGAVSTGMFVVSGVSLLSGTLLLTLPRSSPSTPPVALHVSPGFAGLSGSFR